MKCKAFIPSSKSYNSLVNSLALGGEVDEAVKFLWEMNENRRTIDHITFRTVMDEVCRQRSVKDAIVLLKELQDKDIVDGLTHRKLLCELEDGVHNLNVRNRYRYCFTFLACFRLVDISVAFCGGSTMRALLS